MNRKLDGPVLGRDRYNPRIWVIRCNGEAVRRGKSLWAARWWMFWEQRRGR